MAELQRSDFDYASHYCEENVWRLFQRLPGEGARRAALFITNAERAVPVWLQATPGSSTPVWDYHVVLLVEGREPTIFDLDSTLPFPCPAAEYLERSFPLAGALPPEYEPHFRLVAEELFLARFASDRSHMLGPDGTYLAPLPPWPPIRTASTTMNLSAFIDLKSPDLGEVLDLPQLRARVQRPVA